MSKPLSEYTPLNGDVREAKFLWDDGKKAKIDLFLNGSWIGDVVIEVSLGEWAMNEWVINGCIRGHGYAIF